MGNSKKKTKNRASPSSSSHVDNVTCGSRHIRETCNIGAVSSVTKKGASRVVLDRVQHEPAEKLYTHERILYMCDSEQDPAILLLLAIVIIYDPRAGDLEQYTAVCGFSAPL